MPADRVAVVLPGRGYPPARPLLHYTRSVLQHHGWQVREVWWQPPVLPAYEQWVRTQAEAALDTTPVAQLIVGKSLGSLAAPIAARRRLPAVWLTPLMSNATFVSALSSATAPTLLVGGTADLVWESSVAHASGHQVFEVDGADHIMETPDPVRSAEILHTVVRRLTEFIGSL